jgi:hypothetical protein
MRKLIFNSQQEIVKKYILFENKEILAGITLGSKAGMA